MTNEGILSTWNFNEKSGAKFLYLTERGERRRKERNTNEKIKTKDL